MFASLRCRFLQTQHKLPLRKKSFIIENADLDQSGEIDISDVVSLVNIILNGTGNQIVKKVVTNLGDDSITYGGSGNGKARLGKNRLWEKEE